ncbi:MAG TPA: PA2779 family protein [Deltaproteobacteria bacterium]|nr:PA2779 family protein [Deltaproteobacteria bacterium]
MISALRNRRLAVVVTVWMTFFFTSPALAAMIPSQGSSAPSLAQDLASIQAALENKLVQEKLSAYGLTPDEVKAKLSSLSPAQTHTLAQASSDVLAGGDGVGFVIGVLIIIILVIVILKLLNKEIIIR